MLPEIEKANAKVDNSYVAIFVDAILHGPESPETVAARNPAIYGAQSSGRTRLNPAPAN
jgi:hypothetical protein